MHCNMCSEKNPCTDCLIQEARDAEIYTTQGGGLVVKEDDWYVFLEPPPWGDFEVGDKMPKDWGIM